MNGFNRLFRIVLVGGIFLVLINLILWWSVSRQKKATKTPPFLSTDSSLIGDNLPFGPLIKEIEENEDKIKQVSIEENRISPQVLEVEKGAWVRWINQSGKEIKVTGEEWESPLLFPKDTYLRRFSQPGSYFYSISVLEDLEGTIKVN